MRSRGRISDGAVGVGARARFLDPMGGDRIDIEKKRSFSLGVPGTYGKRFCDACRTLKPKGERKAVKGWKCDACAELKT